MSRGCCLTAVSMLSDILNTLDYAFYFVACSIGHNIDEYAHLKTSNTQVAEQSNSGLYKLRSMLPYSNEANFHKVLRLFLAYRNNLS